MNPHYPPARPRGRYTRPRGGRGFNPGTPRRAEYHGPVGGSNMPPVYSREPHYYPPQQQTPAYQQYIGYQQYPASSPYQQNWPTYNYQPTYPSPQMNPYQSITPPSVMSPTVSNIHPGDIQDMHEASQLAQGNATVTEREPIEHLLDLRPLTTFLEKFTTSDYVCFTTEVDGIKYTGYGMTKIGAKQNAAIDALRQRFNIICTNTVQPMVDSDSDIESIASEASNVDSIANPRQSRPIQSFLDIQDEKEKRIFTFLVKECGGCTSTDKYKEKFSDLGEDFDEWILKKKTILAVYKKNGRALYITPLLKDAKVCSFYGGNKSCSYNPSCQCFHLCKFDVFGRCKKGSSCPHEHSLEKGNNKDLKSKLGLDAFSDREIKIILQYRYPQVCPASQCEATSPRDCPFLHICFNFLQNKCRDSKCEKGHTLSDPHNRWVLTAYRMKKISLQKLKYLIGLRKIPINNTKRVSTDEEHDLASDFESFLVVEEAGKTANNDDDDGVDIYPGDGHRMKLFQSVK